MGGWLLDEHVKQVEARMWEHVKGGLVTGQCDGWKNVAKRTLVSSMMSVDFEEQKTTTNLLLHVLADIQVMEEQFGVTVITLCSDAAGDAHKM
ncbi:hypothetical protein PAXRUDRAFT_35908 [Paxillus rubicundulus Ve08.2h10]|uniref:DUF659 domain-containing protein n=1 Tax=Paxillus rubicundulus Ve08.2h10 TaxID=930991 RepID=A0A0D0DQ45_9AGAM|nr:hypothetical protein PAXRUDRAFT_35908 [Paxillus rubicundulus Ve08.2h10]